MSKISNVLGIIRDCIADDSYDVMRQYPIDDPINERKVTRIKRISGAHVRVWTGDDEAHDEEWHELGIYVINDRLFNINGVRYVMRRVLSGVPTGIGQQSHEM